MVARLPESDAIMPRRTFKSRANQFAAEPESATIMQLSGSRRDNSQKTRCGLIDFASFIARDSKTLHHSATFSSMRFRHCRSCLRANNGAKARNVYALSQTRLPSYG